LTIIRVLWELILSINPLSLLLLIPAIVFLFNTRENGQYIPIALTIIISTFVLSFSQGKQYYFFPIILTLLPFGGICWEAKILNKTKWLIYPSSIVLFIGVTLIPFGMPIYSLENYINYDYQFEKKEIEGGEYGIHFEERYSKQKWEETMFHLGEIYDSLPKSEKKNTLIWGKHYSQAGAVNLLGADYNLPESFSYHGSFYIWAPTGQIPKTIIALRNGDAGIDFFEPYFEEVKPARKIYNPYADEESKLWQTIYICKNPKQDFDTMKILFKNRIFE